jgi:hypothetical protein
MMLLKLLGEGIMIEEALLLVYPSNFPNIRSI